MPQATVECAMCDCCIAMWWKCLGRAAELEGCSGQLYLDDNSRALNIHNNMNSANVCSSRTIPTSEEVDVHRNSMVLRDLVKGPISNGDSCPGPSH